MLKGEATTVKIGQMTARSIDAKQTVKLVEKEASSVVLEIGYLGEGQVNVEQKNDEVKGGSATGITIDKLG